MEREFIHVVKDVLCNAMGDEEFGEILFFKNQLQTHYEK